MAAILLACGASVSVGFGSKERDFWCFAHAENAERAKNEIWGWGRGRKETLADKPLDFENLRLPANRARDWLGWSKIIDKCRSKVLALWVPERSEIDMFTESVQFSRRTKILS